MPEARSTLSMLSVTLMLLASLSACRASGQGRPPLEGAGSTLAGMSTAMGLTPEETERLRPLVWEHVERKNRILEEYGAWGPTERMRQEIRILERETDRRYAEVLTPKQMRAYLDWKRERVRAIMEQRGAPGSARQ